MTKLDYWVQKESTVTRQFWTGEIKCNFFRRRLRELAELSGFRLYNYLDREKIQVPGPYSEQDRQDMEHHCARNGSYQPTCVTVFDDFSSDSSGLAQQAHYRDLHAGLD